MIQEELIEVVFRVGVDEAGQLLEEAEGVLTRVIGSLAEDPQT